MKINELIPVYLTYLRAIGRPAYSIRLIKYNLRDLVRFLATEQVDTIEALSREILEVYQLDLAFRMTRKGRQLAIRTQEKLLESAKGFTRYLKEKDYLVSDPGEKIKLPKAPKPLPKVILSVNEIKRLLHAPDMRTNRGFRNRVILEILYDTAIRRSEMAGIKVTDMDLDGGYIRIKGKGNKDRVVPLSQRVCELVRNYLLFIRPCFVQDVDNSYLILNRWGHPMKVNGIWAVVKRCVHLGGIKKNVSTHTLRHACATHMLRNGAPVRHLQEMLGHASLESTQIYTHVTINDLKAIHAKYHPSETLQNKPK